MQSRMLRKIASDAKNKQRPKHDEQKKNAESLKTTQVTLEKTDFLATNSTQI